jgi:hypothetical protein
MNPGPAPVPASRATRGRGPRISIIAVFVVLGCGALWAAALLGSTTSARLSTSSGSHVVEIVMENKEGTDVLGSSQSPFVNALARRYAVATQSYAVTHPSLPNYLALTSGSTHGIASDCTSCGVSGPDLAGQLTRAGISWKAYLEGYPGRCFLGPSAGNYAKKHDPFAYYRDVARSPSLCSHLVGFGALSADLRTGRMPTFAWITPNLCNDTHDCGVATGDRFLARTVPAIIREIGPHGFLVLTWDEGSSNRSCCGVARGGHIATLVAGPDVTPGGRMRAPLDHFGVLATIERALALPRLGRAADPRSGLLDPLFAVPPRLR